MNEDKDERGDEDDGHDFRGSPSLCQRVGVGVALFLCPSVELAQGK